MLQRVRDLKVQFNNDTLSSDDKDAIASEVYQIGQELGNVATGTKFNGNTLLEGKTFNFQVGANDSETISTTAVTLSGAIGSGGTGGLSELTSLASATAAGTALATGSLSTVDVIDNAIKNISTARANFGAVQNRLDHRLNNLATYQENLTASESRIRDVDMASEMTSYTKANILQQAGTSMLAQANQNTQSVLSLLRG